MKSILELADELLENQVARASVASNEEGKPHIRRAETRRICQILPNTCPTVGWYSEAGFLWLAGYSSIEKRIVDNPLHVDANVDAMVLKALQ